uniref:Uncharacterized protein n=1 Tax=Arundo donax TaxID=35708 RepID=A0A0A9HSQ3_ARUDO
MGIYKTTLFSSSLCRLDPFMHFF